MDIYQSVKFIFDRMLDHTTYSVFFVFLQKNLSPDYLNCWSLNWNFERTKKSSPSFIMWVGITFITGLLAFVRNTCLFTFPLFQCLLTIFGTFFILARLWAFILDLESCSSVPIPIKENMSILCNINGTYIKGFGVKVTVKKIGPALEQFMEIRKILRFLGFS